MDEDGDMDTDLPQRLLVGVALQGPPTDPRSAVLARAVEEVVLPALFVEFDWRTTIITPDDDLQRGHGRPSRGRDWDALRSAATHLESGGVAGLWFPPNRGGLLYAASRSGAAVASCHCGGGSSSCRPRLAMADTISSDPTIPVVVRLSPRKSTAISTAVTGSRSVATTADPLGVLRSPVNSNA